MESLCTQILPYPRDLKKKKEADLKNGSKLAKCLISKHVPHLAKNFPEHSFFFPIGFDVRHFEEYWC